jgi:hypothetical protein
MNQVYFYPVNSVLDLKQLTDPDDVIHRIRQYIRTARANAFFPQNYLNIWVVDMINTTALGIGSFPWNEFNDTHGIITSMRVFFPNINREDKYNEYKTFTHEIGHWCGLLHTFSKGNIPEKNAVAINMNDDKYTEGETTGDYIEDTPYQKKITSDPTKDRDLLYDNNYNPLFMNFMDYTYDSYLSSFTVNQVQKMRYMLLNYRREMTNTVKPQLPTPKDNLSITMNQPLMTNRLPEFPLKPAYLTAPPNSVQYNRRRLKQQIKF